MKLRAYIDELQKIEAEHGDIDVLIQTYSHTMGADWPKVKEKVEEGPDGEPLKALLLNP